jgi:hypothetical protein
LQKITVQNLRLRIQPKLFCNAWKQYDDYPQVQLPDGRTELVLGDLVHQVSDWGSGDEQLNEKFGTETPESSDEQKGERRDD